MSTGNRTRRRELGLLPEPAKCVARKKDGTPCKRSPIKGASVCRAHGGAAPQVRRKAAERIANASDVAAVKLVSLMQDPAVPYAIQLAAAKDLLDRADVSGKSRVEVEVKPYEELLDGIVADVPAGTPMRAFAEAQDAPALVVDAERVDTYTVDNADWSLPEAAGAEPPTIWDPRRTEIYAPPEPAKPALNGDDGPPPRHYSQGEPLPRRSSPTARPPRRGRRP